MKTHPTLLDKVAQYPAVALVLQGGGALGAYQAGAYQALCRHEFEPQWVAGISIGGTDLGFWFAQQGSILTFIAIIFFYSWRMNKLDEEFGVHEE